MATVNSKWILFMIRLEKETYQNFHERVNENGQNKSKVVRLLIKEYLKGNFPRRRKTESA